MTPCARCGETYPNHPGGFCPDVVDADGTVAEGETRIFEEGETPSEEMAVVPLTGEVVDLKNPTEVALALDAVDEIVRLGSDARRVLKRALGEYAEARGERTFEVPGAGTWVREGPIKEYDDPAALALELLEAGMPKDRVREIVVETVDRKVNGTEAQKAARSNPTYKEVIDARTRTIEKPYSVRRKKS